MTYEELMEKYGNLSPTSMTAKKVREAIIEAGTTYMEPLALCRVHHAPLVEILADPDVLLIADAISWPEPHVPQYASVSQRKGPRQPMGACITRRQHKRRGDKGKWRARVR